MDPAWQILGKQILGVCGMITTQGRLLSVPGSTARRRLGVGVLTPRYHFLTVQPWADPLTLWALASSSVNGES